mmetsp:Transcript_55998/g.92771  ORF Transcript_55998/g.92771 Transcript_55998/m.92771 type:complete len:1019 (+) Transcript_55998:3-3059(+)
MIDARGIPGDRKQLAKGAADYLHEHDLVRMLQDLLHGLLVSRPADPWTYVDNHLARAKAVARKSSGEAPETEWRALPEESVSGSARAAAKELPSETPPESLPETSPSNRQHGKRGSMGRSSIQRSSTDKRGSMKRGSIQSRSKVDALMDILKRTQSNLDLVLPLLPPEMRDLLVSQDLYEDCVRRFSDLDAENKGHLSPEQFVPVIVQLSTAKEQSISPGQCSRFVDLFDTNQDGTISKDEFLTLTQFVILAAHLESEEGQRLLKEAHVENERFAEFLDILENDKERINDVVPFLPDWLVEHLTSDEFMDNCMDHFDALDVDFSGQLEAHELMPVILSLAKVNPLSVNQEKCKKFVMVFDKHGNGAILRDEFIEFAQFLAVMNFLSSTVEGQQVQEAATHVSDLNLLNTQIAALEADRSCLPQVMALLPRTLVDDLGSEGFAKECVEGFQELDKNGNKVLDPTEVFPLVMKLCEAHPVSVDYDTCKKFTQVFDKDRNGVISVDEFAEFCRFIIVMGYLYNTRDWHDVTVQMSRDKIEELLRIMTEHCDRLDEVMPLLPIDMQEELLSSEFAVHCMNYFTELDKDNSGVLEPKELIPVLISMCEAHPFALTKEQCLKFVDLFDTERNGVITRQEFVAFARFMMILAYLETEQGQVALGEQKVEELLAMMERDRSSVHKIVPLLPQEVFDHLTSDEFITHCHDRFVALDADNSGTLDPGELFPVVQELSEAHPCSVDWEQCRRFTEIFDIHGDGVIRMDEFLDFARFLTIMSYLHSEDGQQKVGEGLTILGGSKQIDELLDMLKRDRQELRAVIPYLPDQLRDELLSEQFTMVCLKSFSELDKDGNGTLEPAELYPIIMDMTSAHSLSLDIEQCARFTDIFDDAKNGVINKDEFVNFVRFLMVMAFLHTEDGQRTLELAVIDMQEAAPVAEDPAVAVVEAYEGAATASSSVPEPEAMKHIELDLAFYKRKAEKLTEENDALRRQVQEMEAAMRKMEAHQEDLEMNLAHTAIELRASGRAM